MADDDRPSRGGPGTDPSRTDLSGRDLDEFDWTGREWLEPPRLPAWIPLTALALSIAGLGISIYLAVEHFTGSQSLSCPSTGAFNCQRVTTGPWSSLLGVPVVIPGLLFFAVMVLLNLPPLWRTRVRLVAWVRLGAVAVGMLFVLLLIYRELFEAKAICVWCTAVHVITFLLFVLVLSSLTVTLGPRSDETDVIS